MYIYVCIQCDRRWDYLDVRPSIPVRRTGDLLRGQCMPACPKCDLVRGRCRRFVERKSESTSTGVRSEVRMMFAGLTSR